MNTILHLPYDPYAFIFGRLLLPSLRRKLSCTKATSQECSANYWHTDAAIKMADLFHDSFWNAFSWRQKTSISTSHCLNQMWPHPCIQSNTFNNKICIYYGSSKYFVLKRFYNTRTVNTQTDHERNHLWAYSTWPSYAIHRHTSLVASMFRKDSLH